MTTKLIAAIQKVERKYDSVMTAPPKAMTEIYEITDEENKIDSGQYVSKVIDQIVRKIDTSKYTSLEIANMVNANLKSGLTTDRKRIARQLKQSHLKWKKVKGRVKDD